MSSKAFLFLPRRSGSAGNTPGICLGGHEFERRAGRSVRGQLRYRQRLAPGLGVGIRAEGPNPTLVNKKKKKAFLFLSLIVVLLIVSEVAARDLAKKNNEIDGGKQTEQYGGYPGDGYGGNRGGGYGDRGGGYGNRDGGYGNRGGGYGNRGGYGDRGGYGGRGRGCRYGCCYRGYYGCSRCCAYAGEAVETQPKSTEPGH